MVVVFVSCLCDKALAPLVVYLTHPSLPPSYTPTLQHNTNTHDRYERSGTMHGLFRVRGFTQDDAHIFCLPDQIAPEIRGVLDLVEVRGGRSGGKGVGEWVVCWWGGVGGGQRG